MKQPPLNPPWSIMQVTFMPGISREMAETILAWEGAYPVQFLGDSVLAAAHKGESKHRVLGSLQTDTRVAIAFPLHSIVPRKRPPGKFQPPYTLHDLHLGDILVERSGLRRTIVEHVEMDGDWGVRTTLSDGGGARYERPHWIEDPKIVPR